MYIKTDGIVLREVAYQDSDKLLTVLTREYGKLTVRARGVRSSRSRSKAACQLLAYSEFTLLERGGRYVVTEATAKEMFPELRNDLELLSLASYFAQAADVLSPEGVENPPFVSLLLNALYALGRLGLPQKLVKAAFELRVMAESGYAPDLTSCGVCGEVIENPPVCFSVRAGTAADAKGAGRVGGYAQLVDSTLRAMLHALTAEPNKVYAFALSGPAREQFCAMAEEYVKYHLGRGFESLQFYRSLQVPLK